VSSELLTYSVVYDYEIKRNLASPLCTFNYGYCYHPSMYDWNQWRATSSRLHTETPKDICKRPNRMPCWQKIGEDDIGLYSVRMVTWRPESLDITDKFDICRHELRLVAFSPGLFTNRVIP